MKCDFFRREEADFELLLLVADVGGGSENETADDPKQRQNNTNQKPQLTNNKHITYFWKVVSQLTENDVTLRQLIEHLL